MYRTATALALLLTLSVPGIAQDRYSLAETDDGTIRLDKKTGAVSFCRQTNGSVICSMAADERTAWETEVENMANRIDLLEKRLSRLEAIRKVTRAQTALRKSLRSPKKRTGRLIKPCGLARLSCVV